MCAKDNGTDYDTVVIGASHARASSDPEQIDKNAGTYSINMAIPGETVKDFEECHAFLKKICFY